MVNPSSPAACHDNEQDLSPLDWIWSFATQLWINKARPAFCDYGSQVISADNRYLLDTKRMVALDANRWAATVSVDGGSGCLFGGVLGHRTLGAVLIKPGGRVTGLDVQLLPSSWC